MKSNPRCLCGETTCNARQVIDAEFSIQFDFVSVDIIYSSKTLYTDPWFIVSAYPVLKFSPFHLRCLLVKGLYLKFVLLLSSSDDVTK